MPRYRRKSVKRELRFLLAELLFAWLGLGLLFLAFKLGWIEAFIRAVMAPLAPN